MGVNLEKGGKVLLEKNNTSGEKLETIVIGCGWDEKAGAATGGSFDLDATIIAVKADGQVRSDKDMIFYGNLKSADGSITHTGDNLTGAGDGDDEQVIVELNKIPADIEKLIVVVDIYNGKSKGQNFGMVDNAFVRLFNKKNDEELVNFDLNFDASTGTGVKFATIFRKGDEWAFSADQVEFEGGLKSIGAEHGVKF